MDSPAPVVGVENASTQRNHNPMPHWKNKLDISPHWQKAKERTISPQELASFIAAKITKLHHYTTNEELQTVHDIFIGLSEDEDADWNDIDIAMQELYDWGDVGYRCWIKT